MSEFIPAVAVKNEKIIEKSRPAEKLGKRLKNVDMLGSLGGLTAERVLNTEKLTPSPETLYERRPKTNLRTERLGHMLIDKQLTTAESIKIDGLTLAELQMLHQLDEKALKRIVAAHANGGDVLKVLNREIERNDKRFERDPVLRKALRSGAISALAHVAVDGQGNISDAQASDTKNKASTETRTTSTTKGKAASDSNSPPTMWLRQAASLVAIILLLALLIFGIKAAMR